MSEDQPGSPCGGFLEREAHYDDAMSPASEQAADSVGYQTRSLTRALAILDAFTNEMRPLSVKDLHERLGLPKPTVSRLARELERGGYLQQVGRAYEIGPKTFELGSLFVRQHGFDDVAQPHLQALAAETLQTACLALLAGREVVNVLVAPSPRPVQYVAQVGDRDPAHATGLGKALLAQLPDERLKEMFTDGPIARYTPKTICDPRMLLAELRRTRRRAYALDDEETALGLRCVAVAFEFPGIGWTGMSVSGPAADYHEATIPNVVDAIRRTATTLKTALEQNNRYRAAAPPTSVQEVPLERET
jgi:IclR family transcriptional regulator, acetate operon repressor